MLGLFKRYINLVYYLQRPKTLAILIFRCGQFIVSLKAHCPVYDMKQQLRRRGYMSWEPPQDLETENELLIKAEVLHMDLIKPELKIT